MFSKNRHYLLENVSKGKKFYELILMETRSVLIKHHPEDLKDGPLIKDKTHSTFRIEKIIP